MHPIRTSLVLGALAALSMFATPALANDEGAFIVRLGDDTTSVERYSRNAGHLEVEQAGRAPRALQRHFEYESAKGALTKFSMSVFSPGTTNVTQRIEGAFTADSMHMTIQSGTAPAQHLDLAMPAGTLVLPSSSPWTGYEARLAKFMAGKADTASGRMYLLGAPSLDVYSLKRLGTDSVEVANTHQDVFHAAVDKAGHLRGVLPISGTGKFSVQRVAAADVEGIGAGWAAREKAGAGMGVLSPRDSVKVTAGGAALYVDYGRPGKRGRNIFGDVVPYGEVWRTGANAATQFRTDKTLVFGGVTVPAGFYTLWTIPNKDGWKLIVNSETGQWGTQHDPKKDLYTIDLKLSALPQVAERFTISIEPSANGGTLNLDWDMTRASASFTVQ